MVIWSMTQREKYKLATNNLCLSILTHLLWAHYNFRLNTKVGKSPDIFRNSVGNNHPTLLSIRTDLSPAGIRRCCLLASNSHSASTSEACCDSRQVTSLFLSFIFLLLGRAEIHPYQHSLHTSGRNKELLSNKTLDEEKVFWSTCN